MLSSIVASSTPPRFSPSASRRPFWAWTYYARPSRAWARRRSSCYRRCTSWKPRRSLSALWYARAFATLYTLGARDQRRSNARDTAWSARAPGKLFEIGRVLAQVLCHTRELAFQICNEFERFSRYLPDTKTKVFYGGVPVAEHKRILKSECPHIIVGTPGRVLQLVREKELATKGISACSANDPCLAFAPEDR